MMLWNSYALLSTPRSIIPSSPHPLGGTNPARTLEGISPLLGKGQLEFKFCLSSSSSFPLPCPHLLLPDTCWKTAYFLFEAEHFSGERYRAQRQKDKREGGRR